MDSTCQSLEVLIVGELDDPGVIMLPCMKPPEIKTVVCEEDAVVFKRELQSQIVRKTLIRQARIHRREHTVTQGTQLSNRWKGHILVGV